MVEFINFRTLGNTCAYGTSNPHIRMQIRSDDSVFLFACLLSPCVKPFTSCLRSRAKIASAPGPLSHSPLKTITLKIENESAFSVYESSPFEEFHTVSSPC